MPRFEAAVAQRCGAAHACVTNSATSALHLACLALGLGPGDRLWTGPVSFVASANCARYCGAEVDFLDIDPATGLLSLPALEARLQAAEQAGRLPKIVMPVHYAGQSCAMAALGKLGRRYGFRIIVDAAHALGATDAGVPVGACRHSDICVFSFHPVKLITTGEGGMATCNDAGLARRLQQLRSHGVTRDPGDWLGASDGDWYYEQQALGFNYRMTDIQAALGISQLGRLDAFLAARRHLAAGYTRELAGQGIGLPTVARPADCAWHLYVIQLPPQRRGVVYRDLRAAGVGVQVHYIPIYRQPYYAALGFVPDDWPCAEAFYAVALSLPLFPGLESRQQAWVIDQLRQAL